MPCWVRVSRGDSAGGKQGYLWEILLAKAVLVLAFSVTVRLGGVPISVTVGSVVGNFRNVVVTF